MLALAESERESTKIKSNIALSRGHNEWDQRWLERGEGVGVTAVTLKVVLAQLVKHWCNR